MRGWQNDRDAATGEPMTDEAWANYLAWDRVLLVAFFEGHEGEPVYLDMDEDRLSLVAQDMGLEPGSVEEKIRSVVVDTLELDRRDVFRRHRLALAQWRGEVARSAEVVGPVPNPPLLPLLAVFVLAAERMGTSDDVAVHAYYPRLFEVLRVTDAGRQAHIREAFQSRSEGFWAALNRWLSLADGRYGLPTAYSISHRYVGVPMSQALVREVDRRRLPGLYRQFGLAPGTQMAPSDMQRLLDIWIDQEPPPVSAGLVRLWRRAQTRERIAEVAALELLAWEGGSPTDADDEATSTSSARVAALLRSMPPRLEVSFLAEAGTPPSESMVVVTADDQPELAMSPLPGGWVRPATYGGINTASLLGGHLQLNDPKTGRVIERRPRRVVPLRRDELLNLFVETERVQLGEDVMILVADDAALRTQTMQFLSQVSRPGFRQVSPPGLPEGWTLITDVVVMSGITGNAPRADLDVLVPLVAAQLSLSGGLRLPGRIRRWSSLQPPEIRAVAQDADRVEIVLSPLGSDDNGADNLLDDASSSLREPLRWVNEDPAIIVDLAEAALGDGDYEITLIADGKVRQRSLLRLRSARTPDRLSWETADRLLHVVDEPLSVTSAQVWDEMADILVDGAETLGPRRERPSTPVPLWATWTEARPAEQVGSSTVVVTRPDPTSCMATGAHRMRLPTAGPGRPTSRYITGECEGCGLVKRYPTWLPASRLGRPKKQRTTVVVDVTELPAVSPRRLGWDAAWDALAHLGGGPASTLDRVAQQVEGSRLFVDEFTRSLESMAFIEVSRSDAQDPELWHVAEPCLAETANGEFAVVGAWSAEQVAGLAGLLSTSGGQIRSVETSGMTIRMLAEASASRLEAWADESGVTVVPEAARTMADALPALGEVESALTRLQMPAFQQARRFHAASASWETVQHAASPGAYRLTSGFLTRDVYRSSTDTDAGTAAQSDVHLSKHLAARDEGRVLLAYTRKSQKLVVPLGADLPGLYARVAVLCSGRLPTAYPNKRYLVYHDVPNDVADAITGLLTG